MFVLKYFQDLQGSIENRPGRCFKSQKQKLIISWQTYEGIKMTVNSVIQPATFLILHKMSYILSYICEDPLENYFGRQRSMRARKDNPTLYGFGYKDNPFKIQKMLIPVTKGNVAADNLYTKIDTELAPCGKK